MAFGWIHVCLNVKTLKKKKLEKTILSEVFTNIKNVFCSKLLKLRVYMFNLSVNNSGVVFLKYWKNQVSNVVAHMLILYYATHYAAFVT